MKIKKITDYLEEIAPLEYQESYDNCGLLIGNKEEEIKNVLITLDCTEAVIDEAIEKKCNLIITHHPIIFDGLKKINGSNYIEKTIIKAIQNKIAIYSIHTNLDNIDVGVNKIICEKLKLKNTKILAPKNNLLSKLIVFCPKNKINDLRNSIFNAGAGYIGKYDNCSFNTIGEGTFKANENCNPAIGEINKITLVKENKLEVVFPSYLEGEILKAVHANHPYEEVAYDIIPIKNSYQNVGSGMIGELVNPMEVMSFLKFIKKAMNTNFIRHSKLIKKKVKRIAVCGGSGSFLIKNAKHMNADIFITSDFKYHEFFNAENDIIIADIGHYESEQFTKELIKGILKEKFPKFATHLSQINTNPINYF